MAGGGLLRSAIERAWWQPRAGFWSRVLAPASLLYRILLASRRWAYARGWRPSTRLPVPVIVVGNLIVGGAGKTPTVIALVQALQRDGWRPGVISRGHGGQVLHPQPVEADSDARQVGDEPLLIWRRTQVPVWVGRARGAAGQALLHAHPQIDIVVADDGLQHLALQRDVELIVFDRRGVGNGGLLPAGPLREPLPPALGPRQLVLYNADAPSTPLPGWTAQRTLARLRPLAHWWRGDASGDTDAAALHAAPFTAAAGIGEPERFFGMLAALGLQFARLPLPDHAALDPRPWPAGEGLVVVTEKDAVKLRADAPDAGRIRVAALDFVLPEALRHALHALLPPPTRPPRA